MPPWMRCRLAHYVKCSCLEAAARRFSPSMVDWPRQSMVEQATAEHVRTLSRAALIVLAAKVEALVLLIAMDATQ